MIKLLHAGLTVILSVWMSFAAADARVFTLNNPNTQQVLEILQTRYGDKLHAELVQEKLVVIGSKQQLEEVSSVLARIDPARLALRLRVREQPPEDETSNVITYSTNTSGYTLDTIEGAFVALDYSQIAQQIGSAASDGNGGWWVAIENTPIMVRALTLQIRVQNKRNAIVVVSYTNEEGEQRQVYGNTVSGELGKWIPLLPQREPDAAGSIGSGVKAGSQLYLRIDKIIGGTQKPLPR